MAFSFVARTFASTCAITFWHETAAFWSLAVASVASAPARETRASIVIPRRITTKRVARRAASRIDGSRMATKAVAGSDCLVAQGHLVVERIDAGEDGGPVGARARTGLRERQAGDQVPREGAREAVAGAVRADDPRRRRRWREAFSARGGLDAA